MRLNDLSEAGTNSPAFRKWFAGSKVVDQQGNPLQVYHGTNKNFGAFTKADEFNTGIEGIFFTDNPSIADEYADQRYGNDEPDEGSQVYSVYLSMRNPLVINYQTYVADLYSDGETVSDDDRLGNFDSEVMLDIIQTAKDHNRDGVIIKNIRDGWNKISEIGTTYVVFNPTQIKSIFNQGGWKSNIPHISEAVEDNPAFQRWFAGSKVANWYPGNDYGKPLMMMHASNADFTSFHPYSHFGTSHSSNERASMIASREGDFQTYPVYLSIKNPLRVLDYGSWSRPQMWEDQVVYGALTQQQSDYITKWFNQHLATHNYMKPKTKDIMRMFCNALAKNGYDGLVYHNIFEGGGDSWVIFDSSQVKSAFNNGGWDRTNNHMSEAVTDDPKFQSWFGDSQIRNTDGSPKIMYHWGPHGQSALRGYYLSNYLLYFNEDSKKAKYAARKPEQEYRAYLKVNHPYGNSEYGRSHMQLDWGDAEAAKGDKIKSDGYDGYDGIYVRDEGGISLAVFDPSQVWMIPNTVTESPIGDYAPIGNWGDNEKSNSFTHAQDRKIIQSDNLIRKVRKKFGNTEHMFNFYFINLPGMQKHAELGLVTQDWIAENMPKAFELLTQREQQQNTDIGNSINVLYVGNAGTNRVPMTAWIMGHRLGHAITASNRRSKKNIPSWSDMEREFSEMLKRMFEEVYGWDIPINLPAYGDRRDVAPMWSNPDVAKFLEAIGTMASARNGNLGGRPYEFIYEMFSQYLTTGSLTFRELPRQFGRRGSTHTVKDEDYRAMYSRDMNGWFADHLTSYMDNVCYDCVGRYLVM